MDKIVQTAGRTALDITRSLHILMMMCFLVNWNNQDIDVKTRSIITVVSLCLWELQASSPVPF